MKITHSSKIVRRLLHIGVAGSILTGQALPAAPSHEVQAALNLLTQKAEALEARDRDDLAAQVWRQILAADPSDATALSHLASYASKSGHAAEARAYLDRLHKTPAQPAGLPSDSSSDLSAHSNARLQEAARLAEEHRSDEALQIYREVFGENTPPGRWAVAYYETLASTTNGVVPAVTGLKSMVAKYPSVPEYRVALGKLMTYSPATREAGVDLLSEVSGSARAVAEARAAWRQALVWEKQNAAYAPSLQAYLARYPDPELASATAGMRDRGNSRGVLSPGQIASDHKLQSGYAALKSGDLASAQQSFEAASHADPRSEAGLGFIAMKKSDFDGAVAHFTAAERLGIATQAVRSALREATCWQTMSRAASAKSAGNWAAAIELYEAAVREMPENVEALTALGGTLVAAEQPARALPHLAKAAHLAPGSMPAWIDLAKATLASGDGQATLQLMSSVPQNVALLLNSKPEWIVIQASAYQSMGDAAKARALYRSILVNGTGKLSADTQTEVASLALELNQPADAIAFASKAVDQHTTGSGAWEVLFSALVSNHQMGEARRVYNNMPPELRSVAEQHAGFAQSLAGLKESTGDIAGALALLEPLNPEKGENELRLKLHIADLEARLGRSEQAVAILAELSEAHPESVSVWRTRIQILNTLKKYNEVVALTDQIPQDVAFKLGQDGDAVSALAAANTSAGRRDYAARLLENYLSHADSSASAPSQLQLAWILLDTPSEAGRLYQLLQILSSDPALGADSKSQIADIWATWILRASDRARKTGDLSRAVAILDTANQQFPNSPKIQKALAGTLLASGDTKRAFTWYSNSGMSGADADDYVAAIGAAMAQHNMQFANAWLQTALTNWPANPKILTIAGEFAQTHGDLKRAKAYWLEALAQKNATQPVAERGSGDSLMSLLVSPKAVTVVTLPAATTSSPSSPADLALLGQAPVQVRLSSFSDNAVTAAAGLRAPASGLGISALDVSALVRAAPGNTDPSLEDRIASLSSQNTPYLSTDMSFGGRNGQAGFDRLFVEQAKFDSSIVLAGNLRASMLLIPTFLSGGSGSGTGNSFFGRQTSAAGFGPQSASGVAGEVQLSNDILGLRLGSTPRGFLVNNWVGGLRIRPKGSHITFLIDRDSVTDTMLSYAGVKDPVTGQISGGVMVNSASVLAQWGSAISGVYASGGYQVLDGRNVERNTAATGNLGVWWRVATLYGGNVTLGMNFSGMGYDHNLRYFTFGQGGYFSPQQYFLFNVPVRWAGAYGHVKYSLAGSYGIQHFTEDGSAYYPLDAALEASSGLMYPSLVVTGANFSLDGRIAYQMTPHWLMGGFFTANNARDYTSASGGLFVRYTFEEKPLTFVETAPLIPDWRGAQPFGN